MKENTEALIEGDQKETGAVGDSYNDNCPCKRACRYHGNCKKCVAFHKAHQEHVPNCMCPIVNQKIKIPI